jgi:ferredoxin
MDVLAASDLPALLDLLAHRGYTTVGPVLRDGAVTFGPLDTVGDLAAGFATEAAPGRYRTVERGDGALFAATTAPHSLKGLFFPPEETLLTVRRDGGGLRFESAAPTQRWAVLGVHACDLAALAVLDAVLLGRPAADPRYRARREVAFLVAVPCHEPAATCFCASMGTGPAVAGPRQAVPDLVLSELLEDGPHRFLVEARTAAGREVAAELPLRPAGEGDVEAARRASEAAARRMVCRIDADAAPALLRDNLEHPRWDEVARRCLTCGNCTLVCPTCFCHTVVETSALGSAATERVRRWDSCFEVDHAYLHGGSVRTSARSRYRQWLTHKLSTWTEQFGTSGCVGCGRCIAWCPAGIDITEEVAAIAATSPAATSPAAAGRTGAGA